MSTSIDGTPMEPRLFTMIRRHDGRGVSGTGSVFDGVVFHNGTVVICWRTEEQHGSTSVGVYDSWEALTSVHIDSHPTNETESQWLSPPSQDLQLRLSMLNRSLGYWLFGKIWLECNGSVDPHRKHHLPSRSITTASASMSSSSLVFWRSLFRRSGVLRLRGV
jgi:hypothetical protein